MATVAKSSWLLSTFAPMSASRLYIFGGITLIAVGMLFGDVFAVFILHQNAGQQGAALIEANRAVADRDPASATAIFGRLGGLLEDRGTKVDAHVHMIDAGYLALLLALLQPYLALSQRTKKTTAGLFIVGGILLPLGIFLIHYMGLAYSPFAVIGWASVLADSAGALLTGGTLLVLLGFLHGAYYAAALLYQQERMEITILQRMIGAASEGNLEAASGQVAGFGNLAGARAVNLAAHSHIIEFGLLAMLLSFVQPYVFLSERWKRRWVKVLLGGSVILPVFVLLELKLGLLAGGIADLGGLMVIIGLIGMLIGILRYVGQLDAVEGE
jgi:hypothetical protein